MKNKWYCIKSLYLYGYIYRLLSVIEEMASLDNTSGVQRAVRDNKKTIIEVNSNWEGWTPILMPLRLGKSN